MAVFQVQASSCQLGGRNISWPECEPTAAGACPLQAWLPRRSVYPHKAFFCGAAIGIAWPELSPLGNTMIYTSECKFFTCFQSWKFISFIRPWTCTAWLNRKTGNALQYVFHDVNEPWICASIWLAFLFLICSLCFTIDSSRDFNHQSQQQVLPSFSGADSK